MDLKLMWLVMALLIVAGDVSAEMYKYVDDRGALRFVESLNEVPKKYRRKATVAGEGSSVSYTDPGPATAPGKVQKYNAPQDKKAFTGSVEIYMTSWCPACKSALAYVRKNGIPYAAYDIEKDPEANRRFEGFNGRGVPLIVVGSNTMRGFNSQTLERWLGR